MLYHKSDHNFYYSFSVSNSNNVQNVCKATEINIMNDSIHKATYKLITIIISVKVPYSINDHAILSQHFGLGERLT